MSGNLAYNLQLPPVVSLPVFAFSFFEKKLTDFYKAWHEGMSYKTIPLPFSSCPSVSNNSMIGIQTCQILTTLATLNLGS
jgi:hypothetical protein